MKAKTRRFLSWGFLILGLLGVFIPHIGFLANAIPTLNSSFHAGLEIVSGILIFTGFLLKRTKKPY